MSKEFFPIYHILLWTHTKQEERVFMVTVSQRLSMAPCFSLAQGIVLANTISSFNHNFAHESFMCFVPFQSFDCLKITSLITAIHFTGIDGNCQS